jgi:hypothetical protein
MKAKPRLDTKENREFWAFVKASKEKVAKMKPWQRGSSKR